MKSKPNHWLAPDDDNRRLSNLCGPLEQNIERIEQALNVQITRRGSRLQISGDKTATQQAITLVNRLFDVSDKPVEIDTLELALTRAMQLHGDQSVWRGMQKRAMAAKACGAAGNTWVCSSCTICTRCSTARSRR